MSTIGRLIMGVMASFIASAAMAQQQGASVSGTVLSGKKPVEAATISLLRAKDSSLVKAAITGKDGLFSVENLKPGQYLVSVSAVGHQPGWSILFELAAKPYQLPDIALEAAGGNLSGVTVTVKKPFVEQKIDRMVVNIDAQPSNAGLTVLELLEKSPAVSVDKDGNISLKGKSGVLVLIDGKPSYLSGSDLAGMLRNMPGSQLEQLEIMTNPPAKYDAAGNAGIINLKTKKNKARGFNGSINLGAGMGLKPKTNQSINLNYRHNKWNLFGNYSYNYNRNPRLLELKRNVYDNNMQLVSIFDQRTHMNRTNSTHNYKLGADFFATKKTTFGIVLSGFDDRELNDNINNTWKLTADRKLQTHILAENDMRLSWKNFGGNFNFRHQFDSSGRELTADLDFLNYNNGYRQDFNNYFYGPSGEKQQEDEYIIGDLPSGIRIYSAKTDYTHPLKAGAKLEAGFKTSFVETDNDARYYLQDNNTGEWNTDVGRSNHFLYRENINAFYANTSKQWGKKWNTQLGLRFENTISRGTQLTTNTHFNRNYSQLFPTAYLGFTPGEKHQWSLNYGRRIERPDYGDMNPFFFYLDKYTYQVGNPYLKPQFAHNIEFVHTYKGYLTTTINYTKTQDGINEVLQQNGDTAYVRKSNIAQSRQWGISISANKQLTKWWNVNVYVNGYHNLYSGVIGKQYEEIKAAIFMSNVNNQFVFKKGWSAELSGFYQSKIQEGVMIGKAMGAVNLGAAKQILKGKGSLKLNIRDPFNLQMFRGYSLYQNVDMNIRNSWDNRVVRLMFTYRFGKQIKGSQPRRQGGAGDEASRVKSGGE